MTSPPERREPRTARSSGSAVPAFLALVAEPLFLLGDAAVVGHLGTTELAGLGIAAVVLQTVVGLCVFLAYGTTAGVARSLGAGRRRAPSPRASTASGSRSLIGLVARRRPAVAPDRPAGRAARAGPEVAGQATTYLRIAVLGVPALLVMLAATGVLRGLQDTRTPLVVAVVGNVANLVLNVVLVHGLGLGIAGSAVGSVLAQVGSAAALVAVVVRAARGARAASLRPDLARIARGGARRRAPGRADPDPARGAAGHRVRRGARRRRGTGPRGRRRHAPAGDDAVGLPRLRPRRRRDRRAGHHRAAAGGRGPRRRPGGHPPDGAVGRGRRRSSRRSLLAAVSPVLGRLFTTDARGARPAGAGAARRRGRPSRWPAWSSSSTAC